jgi:hypothetical protein
MERHHRGSAGLAGRCIQGTALALGFALVAIGCSAPAATPSAVQPSGASLTGQAAQSPEDFAARGWECRPSPVPGRVVCSHPQQGFPAVPPPADRPPSYTLKAWENGVYVGTITLIRPDLYEGQPCDGTGQSYILRSVIGYYECLHRVGP